MKKLLITTAVALTFFIGCVADNTELESTNSSDATSSATEDESSAISDTDSAAESSDSEDTSSETPTSDLDGEVIFDKTMMDGYDFGAYGPNNKQPTIDAEHEIISITYASDQSAWILPAEEEYIDLSGANSLNFTYTSDEQFFVRLMWGELPDGYNAEGAPYWEGNYDEKEGGFILADSIAATDTPTEFSIDFDDMLDPAHQFHVDENDYEGSRDNDLSKVHQIVIISTDGTVKLDELRFED
ncbi:MAG: hypothetical protein OCD01_14470 [Fibrobacterales bacterium]